MSARVRAVVAVLVAGAFIGLLGRGSGHLPPLVHWSAALGAPWLATAFAVGSFVNSRLLGTVAGGCALTFGVAVYYSIFHWVEGTTSLYYAVIVGTGWGAVAFFAGAAFAYAGAAWRSGSRRAHLLASGLLAGALIGESVLLLTQWQNPVARTVLMIELVVGAMVPLVTARRRELPAAVVLALVFALIVMQSEGHARAALRIVGWAGS
jgi:hypothetical protein